MNADDYDDDSEITGPYKKRKVEIPDDTESESSAKPEKPVKPKKKPNKRGRKKDKLSPNKRTSKQEQKNVMMYMIQDQKDYCRSWGERAASQGAVYVDLWEPYLESQR